VPGFELRWEFRLGGGIGGSIEPIARLAACTATGSGSGDRNIAPNIQFPDVTGGRNTLRIMARPVVLDLHVLAQRSLLARESVLSAARCLLM